MCGIIGIVGRLGSNVNQALYDGLTVLQHRGQDAAGIMTEKNEKFNLRKGNGLVSDVFYKRHMQKLLGHIGIGHVRYPTAGSSSTAEAQPFYVNSPYGLALAHNGNLTNSITLRNKLVEDGAIFYTTSDTETIVQLIAKSKRAKTIDKIVDAIFQIQGGYALVMLTQTSLVGVRDPFGIRPLVIGKLNESYILASETCALDIVGAKFIRNVENGEIILWDLLGNTVLNKTIENKVTAVDVKTLNPGVYLYKLKTGQSIYSGKLMTY